MTTETLAPPALDELALRRPEFKEGNRIKLVDGQEWTFPVPVVESFYSSSKPDGSTYLATGYEFGPEFDAMVEAYMEAGTVGAETTTLTRLAYDLLRRNYDLKPGDMRHLLRRFVTDHPRREESEAIWQAVGDHVLGRSPKKEEPTTDGSGPSSTPTG